MCHQSVLPVFASLTAFFADPRYRSERIFVVVFLPLVLAGLAAAGWLLIFKLPEPAKTGEPAAEAVLPAPTPRAIDLAGAALRENRLDDAEKLLQESIARNEDVKESLTMLGTVFLREKRTVEAMPVLDRLIREYPGASPHFRRAECLLGFGRLREALADLDKAVELAPSHALYSNRRHLLLIELGEDAPVFEEINSQLALGLTSVSDSWIMAAAALALKNGNLPLARKFLAMAARQLKPREFAYLLRTPVLAPYREDPSILPFFLQTDRIAGEAKPEAPATGAGSQP